MEISGPSSFYEVEQNHFAFAPSLEFRAGEQEGDMHGGGMGSLRSKLTIGLGPIVKYSDTPLSSNEDKFIGSSPEYAYGTDSFGQSRSTGRNPCTTLVTIQRMPLGEFWSEWPEPSIRELGMWSRPLAA